MAESTLALTRTEIKQVLGYQAGWGATASSWTTNQTSQIDRSIKRGLRMSYNTRPTPFSPRGYTWNFLEPTTTLKIFGSVAGTTSGAPSYVSPSSTITATVAKFLPSMIGQTFTFVTSGTGYVIDGYTSTTVVTVTGDASAEASGDTFTITPDYVYRLPDDFGYMIDTFTHPSSDTAYARGIEECNEGYIRSLRERSNISGPPEKFAVRPVASDGSSGQRFEVLFWPDVDQAYSLLYKYSVLPNALVDTTNEYPLGGALHGEMILAACRAALDLDLNGRKGVYYEDFIAEYHSSVIRDSALAPKRLGNMGIQGNGESYDLDRSGGRTNFTVNGTSLSL